MLVVLFGIVFQKVSGNVLRALGEEDLELLSLKLGSIRTYLVELIMVNITRRRLENSPIQVESFIVETRGSGVTSQAERVISYNLIRNRLVEIYFVSEGELVVISFVLFRKRKVSVKIKVVLSKKN